MAAQAAADAPEWAAAADEVSGGGSEEETTHTPRRPRRENSTPKFGYVFTRQGKRKRRYEGHMLRNGPGGSAQRRRAIEVGPATVERTTQGAYEWADGALRKRRRDEDEAEDGGERRLRPRDPGKRG